MNATEKLYLPVDGILEMFDSITGKHHSPVARPVLQSTAFSPAAPHQQVSNISKSGMGIVKTVQWRWRQLDKSRSSSAGDRRVSTGGAPADLLEPGPAEPKNRSRIVALGAPKVGKTNMLRRFLGEGFEESYKPTKEDFHRKLFHIGGEAYQLELLDAARERDFPAKRRLSILTGDIFLLVFSVDDRDSFREVCALLGEIKAAKAQLLKSKDPAAAPPPPPLVICGNKADLPQPQRAVGRPEVEEALGGDVAYFFETSAKDGAGLEGAFGALAALGGLPDETKPSRHQLVSIRAYQSLCVGKSARGRRESRAAGRGEPCAAVDPLARRPSFTSDLQLVLGSSTKRNKHEKCHIQ